MENNTIDIIKHFSEIYKIHFTDKEADLLRKFFTESDIGDAKYHICPISNIDNFHYFALRFSSKSLKVKPFC